jgi:galactokinase
LVSLAVIEPTHASSHRFQAPGRANLIGEHTDYNDGFVLPAAIQLRTRVNAQLRPGRELTIRSASYPDTASFDLDDPNPVARNHWSDYVRGVADSLAQRGFRIQGADLQIESDIPTGAGLSSSAAVEVASALALLSVSGLHTEPLDVAQMCRRAENDFVGIRSGIMDQFASCFGRRDHALMLDCRSLEVRYVPLPPDVAMMVCNTKVKHELAASEYNARRLQCEQGVAVLSRFLPGVHALRDVSAADLGKFSAELDPVIHRRCRHVVSENGRVLAAADALERRDLKTFGALMVESHQSLRLDYEVSCPELDVMCELALAQPGVYGARMTGGGFGGCVLALAGKTSAEAFAKAVASGYHSGTGIECEIYECFASEGAGPDRGHESHA